MWLGRTAKFRESDSAPGLFARQRQARLELIERDDWLTLALFVVRLMEVAENEERRPKYRRGWLI